MRAIVRPTVSKTALEGTSLPITVTLSHPATDTVTVRYATDPDQGKLIQFDPAELKF